jgi:hypothetical protein
VQGEYLTLLAAWGDLEPGGPLIRAQMTAEVADLKAAEDLGLRVAQKLIEAGAQVVKPA